MCNAWNHAAGCRCGWGGDGNLGGSGGFGRYGSGDVYRPVRSGPSHGSASWWKLRLVGDRFDTPNAKCPRCGQRVYFVRPGGGGAVYFDEMGPPWPKHPCMDDGSSSTSADFVRSRSWRYVDGISVHRKGRVSVVSWGFGSFAESWNTARAPDVGAFAHVTASADGASGQLTWLDRNGQPHVVILTKPIGSDDPYLCVPTADRCRVAIADAILAHSRLPWLTGVQLANHVLARLEIEHHRMESTSVARSALSNARGKLDYLIHPIAAAVDRYWR